MVLAAASSRIVGERDDAAVERVLVEQAAQLLAADDVRLVRLDPDLQTLRLRQAIGPAARRRGTPQPRGEGVLGQVLQTGQPFHAPDFAAHPLAAAEMQGSALGSVVAVPLRCQGELLGALLGGRGAHRPPLTAADAAALQVLADVAAARLGALDQAITARASELAALDPTWRLPPEQAGDFVLVVKNRKQVVDADEAACRFLDYPREVLLSGPCRS